MGWNRNKPKLQWGKNTGRTPLKSARWEIWLYLNQEITVQRRWQNGLLIREMRTLWEINRRKGSFWVKT